MRRDFFVSHATEDKDDVARPLAVELSKRGFTVWFDEFELTVGDSLTRKINQGLATCRFGIVVLSEAFFNKQWPQEELGGLMARSVNSDDKVILPVWHNISRSYVLDKAPTLADKVAAQTHWGIDSVANNVARALPIADYATRQRVVGQWRDPADGDVLYLVHQGGEVGGIYDFARKKPTGLLRGVILDDLLYYQWTWIDEPVQGAGRLAIDFTTMTMAGQWWHHEKPGDPHDVRYEFIDNRCPRWLTPLQIKSLMYRLFYT